MKQINTKLILVALILFVAPLFVKAQEKVTMMNGNILFVTVKDTLGEFVKMSDPEAKKVEDVAIEKSRIFSILFSDGREYFVYQQDTLSEENYLSAEEMRSYITGMHDANSHYRAPWAFWGSFGIGAASGVVFPAFISPLVAGAGAFLFGSSWIKINRRHISDPKFLKDPNYISGYENGARQQRVQNVIKGAVVGVLIGAGARYTLLY